MIKTNVILHNKKWQKYIKNPSIYIKNKFNKLSKVKAFNINKEFSILLTDNKNMKYLNNKFRKKNIPTDVLSFDLSSTEYAQPSHQGKRHGIHGEIIASAETALREARVYSWSPEHELSYYLIHGLLHLVGYDDQTPSERISMRRKERSIMKAIGLPAPPRRRPKTTCHQR